MPEPCNWAYEMPDYWTSYPGEFCPDDAVEGEPYCAEHGRLADV